MTNKEKIKAEIKRLKIEKRKENLPFHALYYDGYDAACNKIIAYLNSLPAEQQSEDMEEAFDEVLPNPNWYISNDGEDAYNVKQMEEMFCAGANWQRKQMMKSAIEVKINRDTLYNLKPIIHEKYQDLKIGDKILIIKEDEQ